MNAPFVRETDKPEDVPFWESPWLHNPLLRDIARYGLGALVVIALLFGVLRPAMRQIIHPTGRPKAQADEDDVDFSVVDADGDEGGVVATLSHEHAPPLRALPSDAYEDRLRQAREAVKADSKQVAQVVKDWVASDE